MEVSGQHSHPNCFPGVRVPSTHWIGCWVGPRDSLDMMVKRKILAPARNRTPVIQSLHWLSYPSSTVQEDFGNAQRAIKYLQTVCQSVLT